MNGKLWIDLVKLLAGFVVLWLAFSFISDRLPENWAGDWTKEKEALSITVEDEERLGDFLMENVLDEYELVDNTTVDSAINKIKHRLMPLVSESPYDYNIMVVDNDQINAITLPGGNIILFSGLIEFAETPEEVAAVMAHEMGHVEQRHIVHKIATEVGLSVAMTLVTGGNATVLHGIASTLLSNVFSRSQEAEADETGMRLLTEANIHPRALGEFFENLNEHDKSFDTYLKWFMTHPHNDERIEESQQFAIPSGFREEPLEIKWERVRASI